MRHYYFFFLFFCGLTVPGYTQISIRIEPEESDRPNQEIVVVSTSVKAEGSVYDTAIFDTTHRVPFKIHEYRGDEMTHNWITLGTPRAPHLYLGGGFYRYDKGGLNDIQLGWYPLGARHEWETYLSVERMFFFSKKSKEVTQEISVDMGYKDGDVVKYCYEAKLRRDKFYGIVTGVGYEGLMNLGKREFYVTHGENNQYQLHHYYKVSVRAGIGRMRCRNIEYEAPFRRRGLLRASSMSRLQIGVIAFPFQEYAVTILSGSFSSSDIPNIQPPVAGYISWEGRTALMNMKREWGLSANFTFLAPSWNRVNEDYALAMTCAWGLYFSLDKKDPDWKKKYVK